MSRRAVTGEGGAWPPPCDRVPRGKWLEPNPFGGNSSPRRAETTGGREPLDGDVTPAAGGPTNRRSSGSCGRFPLFGAGESRGRTSGAGTVASGSIPPVSRPMERWTRAWSADALVMGTGSSVPKRRRINRWVCPAACRLIATVRSVRRRPKPTRRPRQSLGGRRTQMRVPTSDRSERPSAGSHRCPRAPLTEE